MKIDHCLILAAGFGTRMGAIGHELPKVLWPVFEKNLLHLQILYAKKLGIKNIYINLHHQRAKILNFINSLNDPDIHPLIEDREILDIGGGIHNLARQNNVNYRGNLLVLNSDQFLFFPQSYFDQGLTFLEKYPACLFGIRVNKSGKYNQTKISNAGFLEMIVAEKEVTDQEFWTYSGISLINLALLEPIDGATRFFESVAPYKKSSIPFVGLENLTYWDFGTLARYEHSMFSLLKKYEQNDSDPFTDFLIDTGAFKSFKMKNGGYASNYSGVIDLDNGNTEAKEGSIVLKASSEAVKKRSVIYDGIQVEL